MKIDRSLLLALPLVACISVPVRAELIGIIDLDGGHVDVTASIVSGAYVGRTRGVTATDGTDVFSGGSIPQTLANKAYTAQIVPVASTDEVNESYAEIIPDIRFDGRNAFASAVVDGAAGLEVGVQGIWNGIGGAVSRYGLKIKNNRSREANFGLALYLPGGSVTAIDPAQFHFGDSRAVHSRVEANVDYLLRSPAGEFGGTFDDTTGNLFNFFVDVRGAGSTVCNAAALALNPLATCEGQVVDFSEGAFPLLGRLDGLQSGFGSVFGFAFDAFAPTLALPTIPSFGELFVYYDMYALVNGFRESGGQAFIGDPLLLNELGNTFALVERTPNGEVNPPGTVSVPEPFGMGLIGVVALAALQRRRRAGALRRTAAS